MKQAMSTLIVVLLLSITGTAAVAGEKPTIIAAVVENTGSAEVVRLVVSPAVQSIEEKIICAEGMIRVRLDGINNRGQEVQELTVPADGPIRRVRIVEKNPVDSVVQLYPRRNPQATCARTTVAAFGKEIVVSTTFTGAEAARINSIETSKATSAMAKKSPVAAHDDTEVASTKSSEPLNAQEDSKEAKASKDEGLVFKKGAASSDAAASPALGTSVLDAPKLALGFGFAALAAGVALFIKKKKKFSGADMDSIDIVSTKRLGVRQQLVLVSVQGVRFLLAVSDKSVTSLGVVSDEDGGIRRLKAPTMDTPQMSVESTLESLISEASRRAVKNETPPPKQEARSPFDSELRRALDQTAMSGEKPATQARFDTASNAAGLVALARMRANLKKSTGRSQVFEA